MDNNKNKQKVELTEESEKRLVEKISKEVHNPKRITFSVKDCITLVIMIAVLAFCIRTYNSFNNGVNSLKEGLSSLVSFDSKADEHDLALDDNFIFGYTAADFEEAILGDSTQLKKIEVYKQEVSDVATLTNTGLFNWAAFTKSQVVTYNGNVVYTVDMSKLNKNDIVFNEEEKIITLKIPHSIQEAINIPEDEIQFADPEKGLLAFGDIKVTPQQMADVQKEARNKMEQKLKDSNVLDIADRFAKLTVWEIYSPVIKGVAKDYSLEVEFK